MNDPHIQSYTELEDSGGGAGLGIRLAGFQTGTQGKVTEAASNTYPRRDGPAWEESDSRRGRDKVRGETAWGVFAGKK